MFGNSLLNFQTLAFMAKATHWDAPNQAAGPCVLIKIGMVMCADAAVRVASPGPSFPRRVGALRKQEKLSASFNLSRVRPRGRSRGGQKRRFLPRCYFVALRRSNPQQRNPMAAHHPRHLFEAKSADTRISRDQPTVARLSFSLADGEGLVIQVPRYVLERLLVRAKRAIEAAPLLARERSTGHSARSRNK